MNRNKNTVFDILTMSSDLSPDLPFACFIDRNSNTHIDISYCNFVDAVRAQSEIYSLAGYKPGQRVAICMPNCGGFLVNYFALNRLGISIVPINPDLAPAEIAYQLQHSEASLLICCSRLGEAAVSAASQIGLPVAVVAVDFATTNQIVPQNRTDAVATNDECAILYTSGTTGKPKGCILTNEYFVNAGSWYLSRGGVMETREGEDRMLNPLPLFHMNALAVSLTAMLIARGCYVVVERFSASRWWLDVVRSRATIIHYLGLMVPVLLKQPVVSLERHHHVRFGLGGGVDPQEHREFEARFGFPLVEGWSMTEVGRVLVDNHEPRSVDTRAIGRAGDGLESRVVNDSGTLVPPRVAGELLVRHSAAEPRKGFFSGYLKDPEATESSWKNGWFHTGDLVHEDETGLVIFVDRKKNIIRRSGENISAAEVDAVLQSHELVDKVATIAVADDVRGEEVFSCIVLHSKVKFSNSMAEELMHWCIERMALYKCPGYILFLDDIPVAGTLKIQRYAIFGATEDPLSRTDAFDLRKFKRQKIYDR